MKFMFLPESIMLPKFSFFLVIFHSKLNAALTKFGTLESIKLYLKVMLAVHRIAKGFLLFATTVEAHKFG